MRSNGFLPVHIKDIGNTRGELGEWVGDPHDPRSIEGFSLSFGHAHLDSRLSYQALRADGAWTPSVQGSDYCGTVGQSTPIFGFRIWCRDDTKEQFSLSYDGVFGDGSRHGPLAPGESCRAANGAPLVAMRVCASLPSRPVPEETLDAALMRRFVSMGENCEFGMAQRLCGAEPLDLFRWGNAHMGILLRLLDSRFDRLADPALIRLSLRGQQHVAENIHYGYLWHTWVKSGEMPPERLLRREVRRVGKQADMLMETMALGRRILVRTTYETGDKVPGLAEFVRLVGTFGPSQILLVSQDEARAGHVERIQPTLMRGFVRKFANRANVAAETRTEHWLDLCRSALTIGRR